ncbi:MAG: hypothetical protein BWX80_02320 [Candidatus Hydrogenedentes bacterium ADurb.Bin101]|nr:MAG: hypothetical protein BWX80_02320 [Candidatus Hydrogenedentes bacterium ADurb.Bin101]
MFRRHVHGRSQCLPGNGDALRLVVQRTLLETVTVFLTPGCFIKFACESPVQNDRFPVFPDHYVGRLEIAMDDPPAVGIGYGLTQADEVRKQLQPFPQR